MADITSFYEGETKKFEVLCKLEGIAQDIRTDTVVAYLKDNPSDPNSAAILSKSADVTTRGATGYAIFNLSKTDTKVTPGTYFIEVLWTRANGETYVVYPSDDTDHYKTVEIKNKISDNP